MDKKYYEKDFVATQIAEIEYVRSPYYELAAQKQMTAEEVHAELDEFGMKMGMIDPSIQIMMAAGPTPENVSFTRYADEVESIESEKHIFQQPRGEPFRRSVGGELFKMQKNAQFWNDLRRSKDYIADTFFPPVSLKSSTLIASFMDDHRWVSEEGEEYEQWRDEFINTTAKRLSYEEVIELGMYLHFTADFKDKFVWRAFEQAALDNLHFYDLKNICQLEWISSSHKPKHTSARFDNLLLNTVIQKIDQGLESREDYHNVMQGFRNKKNIDVHLKMQRLLIDKKDFFNPREEGKEKEWALNMVNLFYSFVSNKKRQFGIYARYAKEEVDEILAHYEDDFCEAAQHLDAEGITKLAQVMYLLKSGRYENIWWRIENRVHELAEVKGALDDYHISNIIRSFSRSQENLMSGSDKLFVHLEPLVL